MQWWDELTFMFRYWFSYIWVFFAFNTKYAYALTFNPSQLSTLCNGYILQNKKKIYAEQKEKTNLQGNTTYDSIFSYNCPFSFNNLTYLLEVVVCWSKQSWYKTLSVSCTAQQHNTHYHLWKLTFVNWSINALRLYMFAGKSITFALICSNNWTIYLTVANVFYKRQTKLISFIMCFCKIPT